MNRLSFVRLSAPERTPRTTHEVATTPIFGLRYLEEEATAMYDVVGWLKRKTAHGGRDALDVGL